MRFTITSMAAFAATAAAISITSPTKNADIDLTKSTKIEWDSVSSDPSSFSIYLVNMHGYPNVNKLVAENVKASDGSYSLDGVSGIDKGSGFQVNLISNDDQDSGILAQSPKFNVKSSSSTTTGKATKSCTSTKATTSRKPTPTSCTRTRGSATASSSSSSSSSIASSTGNTTSSASETAAPPVSSFAGAASLRAPAAAGSLLMGLFFWAM